VADAEGTSSRLSASPWRPGSLSPVTSPKVRPSFEHGEVGTRREKRSATSLISPTLNICATRAHRTSIRGALEAKCTICCNCWRDSRIHAVCRSRHPRARARCRSANVSETSTRLSTTTGSSPRSRLRESRRRPCARSRGPGAHVLTLHLVLLCSVAIRPSNRRRRPARERRRRHRPVADRDFI